ncbi:ExbD/TolR family protein [Algihabitans albus]|uniref:ExbD/TolR family protein n=1 Tax=Algihabitans albus TaxID=2164067 RepID=UPI000E5D508B|nr:biopolymer transporter ExbD [Algihabitans albus]
MQAQASAPSPPRLASRASRRRALISLTPLIDVVFILLIFFMLASSFLDWRAIELNAPAQAAAGASVEGALLVEVRSDGLRLSGETVSLDGLATRVAARIETTPDQRVLVRPASGVALQEAVAVLDRLTAAGVSELSLVRDGAN